MTKPTGSPRGRSRKTPAPPVPPAATAEIEIDDLIGDDPAPPADEVTTNLADVYAGVSASWLAHVFGMDKNTIAKKLSTAGVQPSARRGSTPLYRIPDAAPYLVKPKVDLVTYIKSLRPNDLPPILNAAYWDAMLKRQKWEENAGDLWRTADVLEVFGDMAFGIKTTVSLWVEEVDRTRGLDAGQRETITQLSDKLLEQIHQQMIEAPRKRRTSSSLVDPGAVPEAVE